MKNYVKPIVLANEELAEGVYAASGSAVAGGSDCYECAGRIHQRPETGRNDFRIQFDARHNAADSHHSGQQILTISFSHPVNFVSCSSSNATYLDGSGTNTLRISYNYHNNGVDNIGLGELTVTSDAPINDLNITGTVLWCNHDCGQH